VPEPPRALNAYSQAEVDISGEYLEDSLVSGNASKTGGTALIRKAGFRRVVTYFIPNPIRN